MPSARNKIPFEIPNSLIEAANFQARAQRLSPLKASLAKAERNLSYATITSPIDGVVISRDVEAGQTVASGFETPTLFTIAADLTQMRTYPRGITRLMQKVLSDYLLWI